MKRFVLSFLCALLLLVSSSSAFASSDFKSQIFNQNFDRLVNQNTEYAFLLTSWNLDMHTPLSNDYRALSLMDNTAVDTFHLVYTTNPKVWNQLVKLFGYYDYYEEIDNKHHRFPTMFAKPRQLSNGRTLYTMAFIKMAYNNCYSWKQMRQLIAENMKTQDLFDSMTKQSTVVIDQNTYKRWDATH